MPYDPNAPTIRELILENIESTLTAMGPPNFKNRFTKVVRYFGNTIEFPSYPAVSIVPGATTTTDQRLALLEHRMPVSLILMVRSQDWRHDLETLIADVRVAILADWTRGGVALTTRGTTEEIIDSEPSSPLGAAHIELEVLYRTLYEDPGSAI